MKERPILFSTPMVQAILEGRKTMTRRDLKAKWLIKYFTPEDIQRNAICKYGKPGDVLWVKETFTVLEAWGTIGRHVDIEYADGSVRKVWMDEKEWFKLCKWKRKEGRHSSLFMFKSMSRIRLLIKSIRVERLQDITEVDAQKEGVETWGSRNKKLVKVGRIDLFESLWISINGPESWEENPFVWVIEFEKI